MSCEFLEINLFKKKSPYSAVHWNNMEKKYTIAASKGEIGKKIYRKCDHRTFIEIII